MIVLAIIFVSFLLYNVLNETLFLKNGKSFMPKKDSKAWHMYDASYRMVLFTVICISEFEFTILAVQMLFLTLISYHILFDFGFNLKRYIDIYNKMPNFYSLFYVGTTADMDRAIRIVGLWADNIIKKVLDIRLDIKQVEHLVVWTGIFIKFVEIALALLLFTL